METPTEDLMGRTDFGDWTVIAYNGKYRTAVATVDSWLCECNCGFRRVILKGNLVHGLTKRCRQCADKRRHDNKKPAIWHRLRIKWNNRGHEMCDEWRKDFQSFYDWAVSTNTDGKRNLVAICSSKPLSPSNAKWVNWTRARTIFREKVIERRCELLKETAEQAAKWCDRVTRQRIHQWFNENDPNTERRLEYLRRVGRPVIPGEIVQCEHGTSKSKCRLCKTKASRDRYRRMHGIPLNSPKWKRHNKAKKPTRKVKRKREG